MTAFRKIESAVQLLETLRKETTDEEKAVILNIKWRIKNAKKLLSANSESSSKELPIKL